jgi:hypothetical protein
MGGRKVKVIRTKEDAIKHQKSAAFQAKGYVYASEKDALDDYVSIHRAQDTDPNGPCPTCGNNSIRAKELNEGGGCECITHDCNYWFCF